MRRQSRTYRQNNDNNCLQSNMDVKTENDEEEVDDDDENEDDDQKRKKTKIMMS